MPFPEPIVIRLRPESDIVTWWFKRDENAPSLYYRDCWVRGSVAWPEEADAKTGITEGCWLAGSVAIVPGEECVLRIYSERMFSIIDPLLDRDGALVNDGPTAWLRAQWERYGCATYYEHQEPHVVMRWHRMVRESRQIGPDLRFPLVEWKDFDEADAEIGEAQIRRRLEFRANGLVHSVMQGRGLGQLPDVVPPVWRALACLVVAAERMLRTVMNGRRSDEDGE